MVQYESSFLYLNSSAETIRSCPGTALEVLYTSRKARFFQDSPVFKASDVTENAQVFHLAACDIICLLGIF